MQVISVKKITVFHVDKLSLHPVIHKYDSNIVCYPLLQPSRSVSFILFHPLLILFMIYHHYFVYNVHCCSVHPSIYLQFLFAYNGPTNINNQLWLGGSKLHNKL